MPAQPPSAVAPRAAPTPVRSLRRVRPEPAASSVDPHIACPRPPASGQVGPAVDVDQLTGDLARVLGGEEDRDPRDLLGPGHAPERNLARAGRDLLLGVAVARLRGVGEPGRDGVDPDAVRRQGERHRAREADHPRLARRVVHAPRVAADRRGGDVDDGPGAARGHQRPRHRLGTEEASLEVHAQHVIPLPFRQLEERRAREDARVVDQDVGRTEPGAHRGDQRLHVPGPRDVTLDGEGPAPERPDLPGHALGRPRVVEKVQADIRSLARHAERNGPADPLLRARDERHLARESHPFPPIFVDRTAYYRGLKTMNSKPGTPKPGNIQTRAFRAGEVIFREGDDPRDEAYLVHAGRVDVRKTVADEQRLLRTYVKGELLGELGLFGGAPRSATAVAAEPVTLVVIPARRLHHLVRTNPNLAVAIIRDLSIKLRATNELLAAEGRRRPTPPGRVTS